RSIYQIAVEYPETRQYFQEHRAEWEAAAGDSGRGRLHDFESRLKSDAATGYFAHANVAASYLLLVIFVGLGVIADRWSLESARLAVIAPSIITVVCAIALLLSKSKGADAALVVGLLIVVLAARRRDWFARNPRRTFSLAWVLAAVILLGMIGVGL